MENLKILIAEDDEASQLLLRMVVRPFGNEIFVVNNGAEAVETCRNQPDMDLVLMDIKMPVMSGLEATQRIREFNKQLIIFAQTAFVENDIKQNAMALGFNEYLSKPVDKLSIGTLISKYF